MFVDKYIVLDGSENHPFIIISDDPCLGYTGSISWIDLLRKSKCIIYPLVYPDKGKIVNL